MNRVLDWNFGVDLYLNAINWIEFQGDLWTLLSNTLSTKLDYGVLE